MRFISCHLHAIAFSEYGDKWLVSYKANVWIQGHCPAFSIAWLHVNNASFDLCWPIWIHRDEQGSPTGTVWRLWHMPIASTQAKPSPTVFCPAPVVSVVFGNHPTNAHDDFNCPTFSPEQFPFHSQAWGKCPMHRWTGSLLGYHPCFQVCWSRHMFIHSAQPTPGELYPTFPDAFSFLSALVWLHSTDNLCANGKSSQKCAPHSDLYAPISAQCPFLCLALSWLSAHHFLYF